MKTIKLFTDGSVNPQSKIGFASYLVIYEDNQTLESLNAQVIVKKFEDTSSTKLEVQGLLWALKEVEKKDIEITVYTDCQNVLGLEKRRERFEKNDYFTKKGTLISNHELYKEFYKIIDRTTCSFIKVKGHKKNSLKDNIDDIFTLVDKGSRNALREFIS